MMEENDYDQNIPNFHVIDEEGAEVSSDGSFGAQPQKTARMADEWWKLGYSDGRLDTGAEQAESVIASEADARFDGIRLRRETQLQRRGTEVAVAQDALAGVEKRIAEALDARQRVSGEAWEPPAHGRAQPVMFAFFAAAAFLADVALAENVVRNAFDIFPRGSAFSWLIYLAMIVGIAVFGGMFKAAFAEISSVAGRFRPQINAALIVLSAVAGAWALWSLSVYRALAESTKGQLERADVVDGRQHALFALCFALPFVAGAFLHLSLEKFALRRRDLLCWRQLQSLAQRRKEAIDALADREMARDVTRVRVDFLRQPGVAERYCTAAIHSYRHGYSRGRAARETRFATDSFDERTVARLKNRLS